MVTNSPVRTPTSSPVYESPDVYIWSDVFLEMPSSPLLHTHKQHYIMGTAFISMGAF